MESDSGQPDGQLTRAEEVARVAQVTEAAPADETGVAQVTGVAPADETGVAQVDEAIAGLDSLPGRPLAEHVAVFEEAHAKLRQVLSDLDDGPADS
jgi:hypothetical protein